MARRNILPARTGMPHRWQQPVRRRRDESGIAARRERCSDRPHRRGRRHVAAGTGNEHRGGTQGAVCHRNGKRHRQQRDKHSDDHRHYGDNKPDGDKRHIVD